MRVPTPILLFGQYSEWQSCLKLNLRSCTQLVYPLTWLYLSSPFTVWICHTVWQFCKKTIPESLIMTRQIEFTAFYLPKRPIILWKKEIIWCDMTCCLQFIYFCSFMYLIGVWNFYYSIYLKIWVSYLTSLQLWISTISLSFLSPASFLQPLFPSSDRIKSNNQYPAEFITVHMKSRRLHFTI